MTDPALMRGDGWIRCCMCGALHEDPYPDLAIDTEGKRWDMCSGECAASGGVVEHVTVARRYLADRGSRLWMNDGGTEPFIIPKWMAVDIAVILARLKVAPYDEALKAVKLEFRVYE